MRPAHGFSRQEAAQEDASAQVPQDAEEVPPAEEPIGGEPVGPASSTTPPTPRILIGEDDGRRALLIDGVVQSVEVAGGPFGEGYWPLMLPESPPRRSLVLGLGGGTIIHLLWRRFGRRPVLAVENDPLVTSLALSAFWLDVPELTVAEADALSYVFEVEPAFDYVAVDLFADGNVPRGIFARPFVKRIRALLTPGGLGVFNFFRDRRREDHLRRLRGVFPRVEALESGQNMIARCRSR